MPKKETVLNNISEEFLGKQVDKVISAMKEIADNQNKLREKKILAETEWNKQKFQAKQNYCNEEKNMIKAEFKRVYGMLTAATPGTDEYNELSESLYNIKKMLGSWSSGYDFD